MIIGDTARLMDTCVIVAVDPTTLVLRDQSHPHFPGLVPVKILMIAGRISFLIGTAVEKAVVAGVSVTTVKVKNPLTSHQKAETTIGVSAWKITSRHIVHWQWCWEWFRNKNRLPTMQKWLG